jgi:heme exporter protein CcmD
MGYVIAAYAVSLGAIGLYLLHLVRERNRLVRELDRGDATPGSAR